MISGSLQANEREKMTHFSDAYVCLLLALVFPVQVCSGAAGLWPLQPWITAFCAQETLIQSLQTCICTAQSDICRRDRQVTFLLITECQQSQQDTSTRVEAQNTDAVCHSIYSRLTGHQTGLLSSTFP